MRVRKRAGGITVAVTVALVAGALAVGAVRADPTPALPAIAPDALLASSLRALASPPAVSGTARTHVDLGLPELPSLSTGASGGGAATAATMLLGDQTFRMWRSTDGIRLAHIAQFQEQVLVANHSQAWAWDSQSLSAVRLTARGAASAVPERLAGRLDEAARHAPSPPSLLGDPLSIARTVLDAVRPSALVSVATPERVAGRDAYILQLRPQSGRTLVGSIDVAIDAVTRLPLRIQVVPRNTLDAALEVGFTSIDYGPIDPSIFAFNPPPGATVTHAAAPLRRAGRLLQRTAPSAKQSATWLNRAVPGGAGGSAGGGGRSVGVPSGGVMPAAFPETRAFGRGFGLVLAVRVAPVPTELRSVLPYNGPLASVALVDRGEHGWVVAGTVRPEALARVQSKLP